MRFCTGGWVENRLAKLCPLSSGAMMNRCALLASASKGTWRLTAEIFSRALARAYGLPVRCAPLASASYSRVRETHH